MRKQISWSECSHGRKGDTSAPSTPRVVESSKISLNASHGSLPVPQPSYSLTSAFNTHLFILRHALHQPTHAKPPKANKTRCLIFSYTARPLPPLTNTQGSKEANNQKPSSSALPQPTKQSRYGIRQPRTAPAPPTRLPFPLIRLAL